MTEFLTRDSRLPPYMEFPRFLMDIRLGETAKLLYMVLLDRARLSQSNAGWTDDCGRVFVYFPIKALAEALHKSEMTVKTSLSALEKEGLILRERRGAGKANRIYVKCRTENFTCDGKKTVPLTDGKLSSNKNYRAKVREQKYYDCKEDESL